MAEGLNRVMLLGNLGADPELKQTQGGQAVLKLRLATSETYLDKNKERKERTEWHSVTIWGKRAEALARFLAKGDRLFIEGQIRSSSYDDREGVKRYRTEINATQVLLNGKPGGTRQPSTPTPDPGSDTAGDDYASDFGPTDDNIPF